MAISKTALDLVREAYRALEAGDLATLSELVTEGSTYSDNTLFLSKPEFKGQEEILGYLGAIVQAYPGQHYEIVDMVAAGDKVVVQGVATGIHTGKLEFPGATIPATGKQITFPFCQIFTVRDGKLVHGASYADAATWMVQEGLIPQPSAVPA